MNSYSQIEVNSAPEVIGVTNGLYQFEIKENQLGNSNDYDNFVLRFNNEDAVQDYIISEKPILKAKFQKKALATDLMVFSPYLRGIPFAVSKKALSLLQRFDLGNYLTIEIDFANSSMGNYFLLWLPFVEVNKINFKESVLYRRGKYNVRTDSKQYVIVNNVEEYIRDRFKLNFEKIQLDRFAKPLDLLQVRGVGVFISENLKNALFEECISGLYISDSAVLQYT